jgi:hypothetical protein
MLSRTQFTQPFCLRHRLTTDARGCAEGAPWSTPTTRCNKVQLFHYSSGPSGPSEPSGPRVLRGRSCEVRLVGGANDARHRRGWADEGVRADHGQRSRRAVRARREVRRGRRGVAHPAARVHPRRRTGPCRAVPRTRRRGIAPLTPPGAIPSVNDQQRCSQGIGILERKSRDR